MNDSNKPWSFEDPPNTAVFTSVTILDDRDWVHYVTHDDEDGAWQFHGNSGPTAMKDAAVIGLGHMLKIEPRIEELADLPLGWHAWRDNREASWSRAPNPANDASG